MKNKEIEIKIKLTEVDFEKLGKYLKDNAKYVGEFIQKEEYFQPIGGKFIEPDGSIYNWLRLRTVGEETKLTFKRVHKDHEKSRNADEYETVVESAEQIRGIIRAMGFEEILQYTKKRTIYKYKKEFEIAMDYVESLGYFVEIEYKADGEDVEKVNKEIEKVAGELGLDLEDESILGYAHLGLINAGRPVPDFAKENYKNVHMNKKFRN